MFRSKLQFVTKICPFSFELCNRIRKVVISPDSEMRVINKNAFFHSSIESISISSRIVKICDYAFEKCTQLRAIDIPNNSELQIIGKAAFFETSLTDFILPQKVKKIDDAFRGGERIQLFEIDEYSEIEDLQTTIKNISNAIVMVPARLHYKLKS